MLNELYITDGETQLDLIAGSDGIYLDNWVPSVAVFKGGGAWRTPTLSDGRRLVQANYDNVIETFALKVSDAQQTVVIAAVQKLRKLLEAAAAFWTSNGKSAPVYLKVQAEAESAARYALIYDAHAGQDWNPFDSPFTGEALAEVREFPLLVERGQWQDCVPLTSAAIMLNDLRQVDSTRAMSQVATLAVLDYTNWPVNWPGTVYEYVITDTYNSNNIYYSTDIGRTWNALNSPNANNPLTGIVAPGDVLIVFGNDNGVLNGGACWRSTDRGITWIDKRSLWRKEGVLYMTPDRADVFVSTGTIGTSAELMRTSDAGVSWQNITMPETNVGIRCMLKAADGNLYVVNWHSKVFRTRVYIPDATDWEQLQTLTVNNYFVHTMLQSSTGRIFVLSDDCLYYTDDYFQTVQVTWRPSKEPAGANAQKHNMAQGTDGTLYIGTQKGFYFSKDDGLSWSLYSAPAALHASNVYYGPLLMHDFWQYGAPATYGLEVGFSYHDGNDNSNHFLLLPKKQLTWVGHTAEKGMAVANKHLDININHVLAWDQSAGTYTEKFPAPSLPYNFLPSPSGQYDTLVFGIDTLYGNISFNSVVLDMIEAIFADSFGFSFQQYDGALWQPASGHTEGSTRAAELTVSSCETRTDWVQSTLNGVLAYWLKISIIYSAEYGCQMRLHRNPYTLDRNFIEVPADAIKGDLPALGRFKLTGIGDNDGGSNAPALYMRRVVIGKRTVSRGADFRSMLAFSDVQTDKRISCELAVNDVTYITTGQVFTLTGKKVQYAVQNDDNEYVDRVTVNIAAPLSLAYRGAFRAFVRCQLTAGASTDLQARIAVRSGSGTTLQVSSREPFIVVNAADFQLIDCGQIVISGSEVYEGDDNADVLKIGVQVRNNVNAYRTLILHDLILIPSDEWSGDFIDSAADSLTASSSKIGGTGSGYRAYLDVDSTDPRSVIKSPLRKKSSLDQVMSVYQPVCSSPLTFDPGTAQRFYFLMARTDTTPGNIWEARKDYVLGVEAEAVQRWLGMRGAE